MMTTEPKDEQSAVKPQVIDLEAEDVTAGGGRTPPEPASDESSPPHGDAPLLPPAHRKRGSLRWVLVALLAGALGGGWLYRDVLSTYFPSPATQSRIDTLEANAKTAGEQLLAVSAAAEQARSAATALDAAVKDAAARAVAAQDGLAGVDARLAAAETSIQSLRADLDQLRTAVASGSAGGGSVDSAALAAIGQRLDALEKDVVSLKAGGSTSEDAAAISALRQTLSDIQAKIAAGTPYRSELDRILRIVPSVGASDVLLAYADEGLPNAQGLAAELRNDIPTLPKPETPAPAENGGYLDGVWDALTSIVTIRDVGEADWPALAEECAALAEAGDIAQAIARIDGAQGSLPAAVNRWRDRAAGRLKLDAAAAEMARAVNLVIAAKGGGQ